MVDFQNIAKISPPCAPWCLLWDLYWSAIIFLPLTLLLKTVIWSHCPCKDKSIWLVKTMWLFVPKVCFANLPEQRMTDSTLSSWCVVSPYSCTEGWCRFKTIESLLLKFLCWIQLFEVCVLVKTNQGMDWGWRLQDGSPTVQWRDEMQKAFVYLKTASNPAPALGLLDSKSLFHLYLALLT